VDGFVFTKRQPLGQLNLPETTTPKPSKQEKISNEFHQTLFIDNEGLVEDNGI
jgi:hypothetical protein